MRVSGEGDPRETAVQRRAGCRNNKGKGSVKSYRDKKEGFRAKGEEEREREAERLIWFERNEIEKEKRKPGMGEAIE